MNTIFIGGSRHVSRLPFEVQRRLDNVVASGHRVIVGDANGVDKAVQKHLFNKQYEKVTVFCSGDLPRNNLGSWRTYCVDAPSSARGFHFYAAKDREMAREADFGLMIWDGKSPGTVLNTLRLVLAGKIAVLFNVPKKDVVNIKSLDQWKMFLATCSGELQRDVEKRATREEWQFVKGFAQPSFLAAGEGRLVDQPGTPTTAEPSTTACATPSSFEESVAILNTALAKGDATSIMNTLGRVARERGMSKVARETGLARESLYRSLDANGNPEFATVLKVLSCVGLQLEARPILAGSARKEAD